MRKRPSKNQDFHSDWLSQIDIDGPFLALPVLRDIWPNGVDRLGDTDDRLLTFKQAFAQWQRALDQFTALPRTPNSESAFAAINHAWIYTVLDEIAEWGDLRSEVDLSVQSPGEQVTVAATGRLVGRDDETAAVLMVCEPTLSGLRETGLDGWAANNVDRLAMLLRNAQVEVGVVTDGQWWALVWAKDGKPTGSGMVNALTWAEEPLLRDAFFTLINQRRFRAQDAEQRLPRLFERSELEAETITEALGTQVRKSVELLVQAFSEERLKAVRNGDPDPLTEKPDDIYQAAVTIMMRIVFLLFAEDRDMLPTEQLYWDSYAVKYLLSKLRTKASDGEEHLDQTYDVWHRLLAVSEALHGGVNYDEMRMPAYGGSLLDPARFQWLHAVDDRGLLLRVSDRVMMHVLESVQTVVTHGERRRISFREIDVEQIGYIYEGLLGYSCAEVTQDIILGLVGKDGEEPEIPLSILSNLYEDNAGNPASVGAALVTWAKENQPAATSKTPAALAKLIAQDHTADERAEFVRLLTPSANGDTELLNSLVKWGNLIRRDLRNIPLVFPIGSLIVIETPSRKYAGAHYTPRSLAEQVVRHTLEPLVHLPGPLQTSDCTKWKPKCSTAILDLKVSDIAAGSGAFLVAAARYLAERLVEAWSREGIVRASDLIDAGEVKNRALREVISRCLYGADINPMAVEMCKVSLWLVSMDKTKPFSFVDDKIFCGNSLLGLTHIDQLRYLHMYPKPTEMHQQLFVDIDARIEVTAGLRRELANPVEQNAPMRSTRAKQRILEQVDDAANDLRLLADGVVAAALPLGGKPGRQLEDAFALLAWLAQDALKPGGSDESRAKLSDFIDSGLNPTVDTDYRRWVPVHWVIEVPEIIVDRGGFDAIVGNPPFLAGKKIATANGSNIEAWTKHDLAGMKGAADLCAHFIRRGWNLVRKDSGTIGMIGSDRIGQGDTAAMAGQQIIKSGKIFRAVSEFRWPGKASTGAAIIWAARGVVSDGIDCILDGRAVDGITGLLTDTGEADISTAAKLSIPFQAGTGVKVYGEGFILEATDPLLTSLPMTERGFLRPFVNGQSLMSGMPSGRFAIDLGKFDDEATLFSFAPTLALHVRETVKPIRDSITSQTHEERYWAFWDKRESLFAEVSKLAKFIVLTQDTRVPVFLFSEDSRSLYSHKIVVIASDSPAVMGVLSSEVHHAWFERTCTTRGAGSAYVVSRCLRTFPFPLPGEDDLLLLEASNNFVATRESALHNGWSPTQLYNAIDLESCRDADVELVREAKTHLDTTAINSYGWSDLRLDHGFHEYDSGIRFGLGKRLRTNIVRRLLGENHRQNAVVSRQEG